MNAVDLFDAAVAQYGSRTAIIEASGSVSFAQIGERSRRLAALFERSGLEPGDAVVFLLAPGIDFYTACAAALRAALIVVAPEPTQWRRCTEAAAASLRVRGIVASPLGCAAAWTSAALRRAHARFVAGRFPGATSIDALDDTPPLHQARCGADDDVALVSFTSGTTGPPKGVLRTHRVLAATQRLLVSNLDLCGARTHLGVLPFFVLANLAAGLTSVLPPRRAIRADRCDAPALVAQIAAHDVDALVASPTIAARLAAHCAVAGALPKLRRVYLGGAPVAPRLLDAWARTAPNAQVFVVYGATEAEPIASCAASEYGAVERGKAAQGGGLLAGRPTEGVRVRVVDGHRWHGIDGEGEIEVAGDNVSPGYLGGATNASVRATAGVHWHRTGDAGYFDASGRLWLTGRCANAVRAPHGVVHPLRVEAALAGRDGVERAAFIERDGRRTLVLQRSANSASALDAIAARVAFAAPEDIVVVDAMPLDRRHAAKTDYVALAALLGRRKWRMRRSVA